MMVDKKLSPHTNRHFVLNDEEMTLDKIYLVMVFKRLVAELLEKDDDFVGKIFGDPRRHVEVEIEF